MNFTYVGEWIEIPSIEVSVDEMENELAYIYENRDEFDDWNFLFNDGADLYVIRTGMDRSYLFSRIKKILALEYEKVLQL